MIIRPRAKTDIDDITAYLGERSTAAADRFLSAVDRTIDFLGRFPGAGTLLESRLQRLKGLRRFSVRDFDRYVIYYRFIDELEIVTVLHTSRDRDAILETEF